MARTKQQALTQDQPEGEIFDRAHLSHYVMQNQDLAAEVVGLFLAQLPVTIEAIAQAATQADWKFATHTLKGSAAAVGARRLQNLAAGLEKAGFPGDGNVMALRIQSLRSAAAEFREEARRAYPAAG